MAGLPWGAARQEEGIWTWGAWTCVRSQLLAASPGGLGTGVRTRTHQEVLLLLPQPSLLLRFGLLLLLCLLLLLEPAGQVPGWFNGVLLRRHLFLLVDHLSPKERRISGPGIASPSGQEVTAATGVPGLPGPQCGSLNPRSLASGSSVEWDRSKNLLPRSCSEDRKTPT